MGVITQSPVATDAVVRVRGVSKSFRLPHDRYTTFKHRVLHPQAGSQWEVLAALREVSLEVRRGETFGIVGRNGSGKSTLLKCIAGIYRLDDGEVSVTGRLAPFIELGVGFNLELTARDNVIANAVLLGLSPAEARGRFDDIIAFAGLEQFVDLKLKNFSSGMNLRLAFAITTQIDADVLVFDEVVKVGDAAFREKCDEYFERLKEEGRTILLVSHGMEDIHRHCDRAMLLDHGRVAMVGSPGEVADAYEEVNARGAGQVEPATEHTSARRIGRPGRGGLREIRDLPAQATRIFTLTKTLASAEFKLKYLDAWLSYFWILVKPVAFFGMLYFVFTRIGHLNRGVSHYPIYLLSALVLWFFFAEATSQSVYCLVAREPLLRRVRFPHVAIPLAVVAAALIDLVMSGLAVLVFMLASGVTPRLSWLELIPILLLLTMLVAGTAMLLSALYVRFRDVDHIWGLGRQLLFYASPIIYVAASYPAIVRPVLEASPLAAALTQLRHSVIDPHSPSLVRADGGVARAIIPIVLVFAIFLLGLWVFHRESPTVAENI